jgi:hypothetical protein
VNEKETCIGSRPLIHIVEIDAIGRFYVSH